MPCHSCRCRDLSLCSDEVSPVKIDPSDDLPKVPPRLCKAFCDGGFGSSTHNDGDNAEYLKKELGFQLSNGKQQYEGWEPWHEHIPCTKLGGTCVPEDPDDDEPCANSGINDTPMRNMYGGCSKDSPVCCLTPCAAMTRGEINPDIFQCLGNWGDCDEENDSLTHVLGREREICPDSGVCCVMNEEIEEEENEKEEVVIPEEIE